MDTTAQDLVNAIAARTNLPNELIPESADTATPHVIVATLLAMLGGTRALRAELDAYEQFLAQEVYSRGATTDQIGATHGITGEGARKRFRLPAAGKRSPAKKVAA